MPYLMCQGASVFKFYPEDPVFNRKLATGDHFYTGYSWNLNYPGFFLPPYIAQFSIISSDF